MRFLVLQGPNLNRLGTRDPARYGTQTLTQIEVAIDELADELGVEILQYQSNHEGNLIDMVHKAVDQIDGIVLNPAGLTKIGYPLANAVEDTGKPLAIVHLSQLFSYDRENRNDVFAGIASIYVAGAGSLGYRFALQALHGKLS